MCQKTEKKLSGVHLGKNCKTMYYRIFFSLVFCIIQFYFPCFLSFFSINCSSSLCTLGHLFFTTVSLLNYASEKFPISADLQSRVLLDFSSIFFITFCQSIIIIFSSGIIIFKQLCKYRPPPLSPIPSPHPSQKN